MEKDLRVGILASTNGTDLPAIFAAKIPGVQFPCLVTNVERCGAAQKAQANGVPTFFVEARGKTREEFDRAVAGIFQEKKVDLILLIGFMRILSKFFCHQFSGKILNVHPSLLPAFAGGMNLDVHSEVLRRGCKVSGATVHFVNEEVDGGAILLQECVRVEAQETAQTLKAKVQALEGRMLVKAIEIFRDKKAGDK